MLTAESPKNAGASVDEGLSRCLGNEPFRLKMVEKALRDNNSARLSCARQSENPTAARGGFFVAIY